jgi:type I restriction enzyme S subunit
MKTLQQVCKPRETIFDSTRRDTVLGSVGKKDFHNIVCIAPHRELVMRFEHSMGPVDGRVEVNDQESRTLADLRDALLPKLISGELRVKDAERFP